MTSKSFLPVSVLVLAIGLGLAGCGSSTAARVQPTSSSAAANATGGTKSAILASGALADAPQNQWVLGSSALAVSRDGGTKWTQVPLPAPPNTVNGVAVLPSETIVLTGSGTEDLGINVLSGTSASWQGQTVHLGLPIGESQLVEANGLPIGVMVGNFQDCCRVRGLLD